MDPKPVPLMTICVPAEFSAAFTMVGAFGDVAIARVEQPNSNRMIREKARSMFFLPGQKAGCLALFPSNLHVICSSLRGLLNVYDVRD
jgi:hypothetical protein